MLDRAAETGVHRIPGVAQVLKGIELMSFIRSLEGVAIGFLMAVPIGAIGILCIRRTLSSGRLSGYITGLAGASADFMFSTISVFGISLISDFVTVHQHEIRLVGGILLLFMGILLIQSHKNSATQDESALGNAKVYFSTLLLGLTNPLVMFGYGAIFSSIGVARYFQNYLSLSLLVIGVFLGSFLWFFALANFVHRFRHWVTENKLSLVNRIAGMLLVFIGLSSIWAGLYGT